LYPSSPSLLQTELEDTSSTESNGGNTCHDVD
jgi:hypothetical protein